MTDASVGVAGLVSVVVRRAARRVAAAWREVVDPVRCSRATLERRVKAGVFPVAPIQGVDSRPRWSRVAVMQWLALGGPSDAPVGRRRRRTA